MPTRPESILRDPRSRAALPALAAAAILLSTPPPPASLRL